MTFHLLAAKFHTPPRRGDLVARPRLLERLQGGLEEGRKLTLISAPAGYGKTTLAVEWIADLRAADRAQTPAISWLSLDEADNDLGRFLRYFTTAMQRAGVPVAETALSLLDLPQLPPLRALLDELLNCLSALSSPLLLVLDDYQTVSAAAIHEAVAYLLDHQPAGVHLVLSTRQDPPLPLARLRARGQIIELRAQELRFTPAEALQFFDRALRFDLAQEAALALEERTEGWAVGLQLAGLALQATADPDRFIQSFRGSHRYVLDYLAEEVIAQQDDEVRAFLAQTSILDQFNADLSSALTGQPEAQALIERLEKANLFIAPLDDQRVWYRYHRLFRDYLATLLDKQEERALQKKASAWHEAHGMPIEAMRYALASGDPEFIADATERVVNQNAIWSGGNIALLTSWLNALPAQTLQARPRLALNASRIFYLASRFDLAEKHLAQAEETLKTLPPTPEVGQALALVALYHGSIACVYGDFPRALAQTTYAQERLPQDNHLAHARACFNLGQAQEAADQLDHAVASYLRSSDEAQAAGVRFLAIQARCTAAQVQIQQGQLPLAAQTCRAAMQLAGDQPIPPLGLAHIVLGSIDLERNEIDAAETRLHEGLALSRQGGLLDNVVLGLKTLARLRVCLDDTAGALALAGEAQAITRAFGIPLMTARAAAFLARVQVAAGESSQAVPWATGYLASRGHAAATYEELTLARVLLASRQLDALPALLHPLLKRAAEAGRCYASIEATLLLSLYHLAKGEQPAAENWLRRSLALAAPRGFLRLFLDEQGPLTDLLPSVSATAPEFVARLLDAGAAKRAAGALANARLPEPLSGQELRVLELIIAGRSNQEIAAELVISVGTAKWHVHNILQKLGVRNRPQAIARAREIGF